MRIISHILLNGIVSWKTVYLLPRRIYVHFGQNVRAGRAHLDLIRNQTYSRLDFRCWKVLSNLGSLLFLRCSHSGVLIKSLICLQELWTLYIIFLALWDCKKVTAWVHSLSALDLLWKDKCFGVEKQYGISDSLFYVPLHSGVLSHQILILKLQYMYVSLP